ncbi:MAG: Gfo/Idh/MocA family oxidoreductase [Rhodopirellula sp.]|nr:Gfo/Idh/MocA family oxidoreductase [Rhodopirellula sp.]
MKTSSTGSIPRVTRRQFLASSAAAGAAVLASPAVHAAPEPQYRVAVIGHTGRGNYGHGLDTVWLEVPETKIVAVADADPAGLAAAVNRLGSPKPYDDYRRMLDEVKPDLVAVGPRWLDQHRDMVVAAAERGVRGIYLEKPLCRTPAEADEMVAACDKQNVKVAVAHQTRYSPRLAVIRDLIQSGKIGRVIEIRARGKEDGRGGAEDLWVLGTHVLDLTNCLAGPPQSCFATVHQDGRPIGKDDVKPGNEGIGPLAGDEVHAMYRLNDGATAYFDSGRNRGGKPSRFGLRVYGTEGAIEMGTGFLPPAYLLPTSSWSPGQSGAQWIAISSAGVGEPESLPNTSLHGGNLLAARDLIAAVEDDRQPFSSVREARTATEMIVAVFESQRTGGPVTMPLKNRENPLAMLS